MRRWGVGPVARNETSVCRDQSPNRVRIPDLHGQEFEDATGSVLAGGRDKARGASGDHGTSWFIPSDPTAVWTPAATLRSSSRSCP
jgi:hypothetical protein